MSNERDVFKLNFRRGKHKQMHTVASLCFGIQTNHSGHQTLLPNIKNMI
jgi:hypothetical protein